MQQGYLYLLALFWMASSFPFCWINLIC